MKIKYFLTILLCAGLLGCTIIDPKMGPNTVNSHIIFLKNTLDNPILVQSYFHQFNDSTNFCQKELIAWSKPTLIQPSEYQIIMDYVIPQSIKIFDIDTVLIVDINCSWQGENIYYSVNALKTNYEEAKKLDNRDAEDKADFTYPCYLKDSCYLLENVPWNIYPIYYDRFSCSDRAESYSITDEENRKNQYLMYTNGYAVIQFLEINPDAECFNR